MYLVYFSNIDVLALNIDILPDILKNDILSSYWKRGKYKILYFPRFQYEESIKFLYFLRIQTEAIKQMVAGESCCILSSFQIRGKYKIFILFSYPNRGNKTMVTGVMNGLCRMVLGCGAGSLMIFLGVSDVQQKLYGGEGQGWLMGIAVKNV